MSEAIQYGYSLFETIRYQNNKAHNLKGHYNRLTQSSQTLAIPYKQTFDEFEDDVQGSINQSSMNKGVVRYQISKDGDQIIKKIDLKVNRYEKSMYEHGFKVSISSVKKSSSSLMLRHKSSNYLENLLVLQEAKIKGFDEALFFNENSYITEGTYTNMFLIKNGKVFTPDLTCGLLKGTMRTQVIQTLKDLKIDMVEKALTLKALEEAEGVFLTNALMGVMPVCKINEVKTYTVKHKIVDLLSDQLMADWFE